MKSAAFYYCCYHTTGCLGLDQPVGPYVHRSSKNGFKGVRRQNYLISFAWLEYEAKKSAGVIVHLLNNGREIRIDGHRFDGRAAKLSEEGKVVLYEFDGCWWHGCLRCSNPRAKDKEKKLMKSRREETERVRSLFADRKEYELVVMRECTFRRMMERDEALRKFVEHAIDPEFYLETKGREVKHEEMLLAVRNESLFGIAQVTVSVPEHLRARYDDFPVVFENRQIPFGSAGEKRDKAAAGSEM